jgi:hypothetical protein
VNALSGTTRGHGASVGDPLPNLALSTLEGQKVELGTYAGKRLLLFFWASW